jgi:hypothetical protein
MFLRDFSSFMVMSKSAVQDSASKVLLFLHRHEKVFARNREVRGLPAYARGARCYRNLSAAHEPLAI